MRRVLLWHFGGLSVCALLGSCFCNSSCFGFAPLDLRLLLQALDGFLHFSRSVKFVAGVQFFQGTVEISDVCWTGYLTIWGVNVYVAGLVDAAVFEHGGQPRSLKGCDVHPAPLSAGSCGGHVY